MENEYKKLYLMIAKHNPFPSNCLPIAEKNKHTQNMKKLFDISRSIADVVASDRTNNDQKTRRSESQIINFDSNSQENQSSSKRIHNVGSHYATMQAARTLSLKPILHDEQSASKPKYETLQAHPNSTYINRRKDLYDNQIEKYMTTKYENEDLIQQYLTNREKFIQQACVEIEKELKQEYHLSKKSSDKRKSKKYKSRLPKIQEFSSHILKKSQHKIRDGHYIQEINQIKKAEQLQIKNRRRNLRVFHRKMNSLQTKLNQLKTSGDI